MKREMKRIMIIGNAGAGKSTLARALAGKLKLPLYHLDKLFWQPGWKETDKSIWAESVQEVMKGDEWIIDGNYRGTIKQRAEKADTIIYMNFNTLVCLHGVLKRRFSNEESPDIPEGCPERLNTKFLNWILFYKFTTAPGVRQLLNSLPPEKRVIQLKSRKEVNEFLSSLK